MKRNIEPFSVRLFIYLKEYIHADKNQDVTLEFLLFYPICTGFRSCRSSWERWCM